MSFNIRLKPTSQINLTKFLVHELDSYKNCGDLSNAVGYLPAETKFTENNTKIQIAVVFKDETPDGDYTYYYHVPIKFIQDWEESNKYQYELKEDNTIIELDDKYSLSFDNNCIKAYRCGEEIPSMRFSNILLAAYLCIETLQNKLKEKNTEIKSLKNNK